MIKKLHFKTMLLLCTMIMGIGSAWAETKSVDITPSQALNDGGVDPIIIVCEKGDGTSAPAISSEQLRLYQAASGKTTGNTITFSSEKTITSIVFTFANSMTADNGVFSEGEYDSSTSTWTGSTNSVTLTVTGTTSGKRIYITAMKVYYDDSVSQLADSDFSLTGAPVALSFDLFDNADAQTISYTTSSTGAVTVAASEYVEAVVNETAKTITVTPKKKSGEAQTITVSQAADNTYKAGSATFTVTISDSTPTTGSWVLTALADLVEGDVFVIVGNNGDTYAMSNDKGTGSAPTAVKVTVEDDEISGTVDDNIKWNISGNANDGYTFYPNGSTTTWLYCTNTNNGVRVGTGDAKHFTLTTGTNPGYLTTTETNDQRYIGIFSSQDWRCYTSINANITGQTFAFYKYEGEGALPTPQINIDDSGITNTDVYAGTDAGSLAATVYFNNAAVEGATVTWSGNNDEAATINATTGAVTLVAAGNVTFTATFAGNDEYNRATATFEMTVFNNDPNAPGTVDNPYTVAQAIENTPSSGNVYIRGIVSSFYNTSIMGDGNNFRYYISDDGTTDTQLLVYRGKGLDNVAFSNADDLLVGDEVVIYGSLTMYQNAPEVASGNYLVSLNRPANTTPSITVDPASVSVDAAGHEDNLDLTYENLTVAGTYDFEIRYCDAEDVEILKPDWIDAFVAEQIDGEGYMVHYNMTENEGDARTAYFKVFAYDSEGEPVYSNLVTITQAAYVAPDVEVDPAVAGVGAFVKVTSTADITAGNYLIVYEGNETHGAVAFNGALETLDAANNGIGVDIVDDKINATEATVAATFTLQPSGSLKSASGLYIGRDANSNGLDSDDEALANTFEIDNDGNAAITAVGGCTLRYNYASDQQRFRYYKSGQQPIQLYKYDAEAEPFTSISIAITDAGYATYCSAEALDFTNVEGLTAYTATVTDTKVSFNEVEKVPALEGVLLKGAEGTYEVPLATSVEAVENDFIGVTKETKINETGIYVLLNGDEGVGFYRTTKAFTVGAHTAYLPALAGGSRSFIGLNETTGISDMNRETITNNRYFDLQGRRVLAPTKGLYIVNGKKVVVK